MARMALSLRRLAALVALVLLALALAAGPADAKRHPRHEDETTAAVAPAAPAADGDAAPLQAAVDDSNRPPVQAANSRRMATPFGDAGTEPEEGDESPKAKAAEDDDDPRAQAAADRRAARAARRFGARSGAGGTGDVPAGPTCGGGCNSEVRTGGMVMGRVLQQQLTTDAAFCCQLCQMRGDCGGWNFCNEDGGCATPTAPLPYIKGSCELRDGSGGVNNAMKAWTHGEKDCDGMPPMEVIT
jgi:hypothetical protein